MCVCVRARVCVCVRVCVWAGDRFHFGCVTLCVSACGDGFQDERQKDGKAVRVYGDRGGGVVGGQS